MKKKILLLATRYPYPTNSGRKLRLSQLIESLINKYNVVIAYFDSQKFDEKKEIFSKEYHIKIPAFTERIFNVINYAFLKKSKSIQESIYWSTSVEREILNIIQTEKPDLIICDMLRTAQYIEKIKNIPKLLDLDDLMSTRYTRIVEILNSSKFQKLIDISGQYGENLPYIARKVISRKPVSKLLLDFEGKVIQKRELEIVEKFNYTILVSKDEANHLKKVTNNNNIKDIPLAINQRQFKNFVVDQVNPKLISFLGVLNVPHNEYALIYFLEEIFPLIIRQVSDVKLRIIGRNVTENIKKYIKLYRENIELVEDAEDIKPYLAESNVFIAPLVFGTGIKTKILEAMALNVPVITTDIGAEGIPAINNRDFIIANNSNDFATQTIKLLQDPHYNQMIRTNGRRFVEENFDVSKISKEFSKIVDNLLEGY
jgi:glycosyltransferase involved in cell wall biosynthesis